MQFPPLYHKTRLGKFIEWKVWTEVDHVKSEYGEVDGKKQWTDNVCTPKNVGRVNAIDGVRQAELEAAAMHKHRLDRKYSLTIEEAAETVFLPMLAQSFEKCKAKVKYPVLAQPKIDGLRATAYWDDNDLILMSRSGKTWDLPHITSQLGQVLPRQCVLDGELYKHGLNLQGINKLAKKNRPGPDGTDSLQFWYFDYINLDKMEEQQADRYVNLSIFNEGLHEEWFNKLHMVPWTQANSEADVLRLAATYLDEGFEGAIIRNPQGLYQFGHRSRDLLKVKEFQDAEFEIVGHYLGTGRHEGCVGFVCKQPEGKTFRCYPKGSLEERRAYGEDVEQYYGQMLKVKFQFLTDEGTPFLPVGIAIREQEDMD